MAVGHSAAEANAIIDALSGTWAMLHTGDPGAAGTANIAATAGRRQLVLNAAAGGVADSAAELLWSSAGANEDITHLSLWSAQTGGTFKFSLAVTADPVTAGNSFRIAPGALTLTHTDVAA